jgi:hypothetical protein
VSATKRGFALVPRRCTRGRRAVRPVEEEHASLFSPTVSRGRARP